MFHQISMQVCLSFIYFLIQTESAFFSGVTSNNVTMNTSNTSNNAPKPSKDAILQLYNQPISGGHTTSNNSFMPNTHHPNTTTTTVNHANYNVSLPSLGYKYNK
jgi:hypothetical protein